MCCWSSSQKHKPCRQGHFFSVSSLYSLCYFRDLIIRSDTESLETFCKRWIGKQFKEIRMNCFTFVYIYLLYFNLLMHSLYFYFLFVLSKIVT